MTKKTNIAIVGAGVAGSSLALYLGRLGLNISLFEKSDSIVNGPPFCHLHAGGNLYREISDKQCIKLLKQSIEFLHFYTFVVDYRPTVIVLPTTDSGTPDALIPRLELLEKEYEKLIQSDINNKVLGESFEYFKLFTKEEVINLSKKQILAKPKSADEWMIPVAKSIDLDKVQFPLILVQEYGLNLFRLSSGSSLALNKMKNISLHIGTTATNLEKTNDNLWNLTFEKDTKKESKNFDYVINAAGFLSGKIDDMLDVECRRMVEFKAAYISQYDEFKNTIFPEIIFHGERGTPQGMGQFTPYQGGYFQLHGMTKDITLYENGLVSSTKQSCQPKLGKDFIKKIESSWSKEETVQRTNLAIKHISKFIPEFSNAKVGSKPLFGAQQIPGSDPTLRVAEVSFPAKKYARCEVAKVSSVIDMIDAIVKEFIELGYIDNSLHKNRDFNFFENISENDIKKYAMQIAKMRDYPELLANRNVPNT